MIDVRKIKYEYIVNVADGKQYDITKLVHDGGWEEGKGELACQINGKAVNGKIGKGHLSDIARNGCLVRILVSAGGKTKEVARGVLVEWQAGRNGAAKNDFEFRAYDNLYSLQKSSENLYFTKGTKTKAALQSIFKKYKIPVSVYKGPDVAHAKMAFKNKKLGDIILEILDEAHTKGGKECIIREVKGKIKIIPRGSNEDVYHFCKDGVKVVQYKQSTAEMVTRVKVIGQADDDGKADTVAVVDGNIKYGIRQQIYTKPKDDSVEAAKKEAEKILKEKGSVAKSMTLEAPDVPYIRKGDKVNVNAGTLHGDFYVTAVRHYTSTASMSMELEHV